jgi:hypothetical protein
MALDKMVQDLVNETTKALNDVEGTFHNEVLISPRRMRALILFSQQTVRWQRPDGQVVILREDSDAPEELSTAILNATQEPAPEPELDELTEFRKWKAGQAK